MQRGDAQSPGSGPGPNGARVQAARGWLPTWMGWVEEGWEAERLASLRHAGPSPNGSRVSSSHPSSVALSASPALSEQSRTVSVKSGSTPLTPMMSPRPNGAPENSLLFGTSLKPGRADSSPGTQFSPPLTPASDSMSSRDLESQASVAQRHPATGLYENNINSAQSQRPTPIPESTPGRRAGR